jgi:hypothetical protein
MAAAAIGETPMFPVTEDWGTVEMPDLARITKFPAAPRSMPPAAGTASSPPSAVNLLPVVTMNLPVGRPNF